MFWQVVVACLAALVVYKFCSDFWRGFSNRRRLQKTPCLHETYVLPNGEYLDGFVIDDYETSDLFLWDIHRRCEWRFSRYDGIESPRTWRLTDRDLASFLRTVKQIEVRRAQGEEDH